MDMMSNFNFSKAEKLEILFIDDSLLAVNKPAGLAALPDGYDARAPHLKTLLEPEYGRLWIVHRLDRDTSGVILLARTSQAHRALNSQFEDRQARKHYHALVCGCPEWETKTTHLALRADGDRRHRTVVDARQGKPAASEFRVVEQFRAAAPLIGLSLMEAVPFTGRTHQIRAHLAALNLPILGDRLYGGAAALYLSMLKPGFRPGTTSEPALIQRCALHAESLEIIHPETGQILRLQARYPKDFNAALRMLRRYGCG